MRKTRIPHEPAFSHVRAANRLVGEVCRRVERRRRWKAALQWRPSGVEIAFVAILGLGLLVWLLAGYGAWALFIGGGR